jgi:hypothetical protein
VKKQLITSLLYLRSAPTVEIQAQITAGRVQRLELEIQKFVNENARLKQRGS